MSDRSAQARTEFLAGAKDIAPLAIGVGIYGLAFGVLAAQAGMDGLHTGMMSAIVFAGSSQIVAIERIVAGAGAGAAVIAGIALNLRLLLITASLREQFAGRPAWQVALGAHLRGRSGVVASMFHLERGDEARLLAEARRQGCIRSAFENNSNY